MIEYGYKIIYCLSALLRKADELLRLPMKKTLVISLEYPPQVGGIATFVDALSSALEPEKTVVLAPPHKEAKEWDEQMYYKVIRRPFYYSFFWPRWLKLYFEVKKIVKQEKIELIMLHHILPVGYVAYMIKKKFNIPYIIFSHGTDIAYAAADKGKRKKAHVVARGALQIITNSESLKKRTIDAFPDIGDKTTVLYPCPDEDFMTPPPADELEKMKEQLALEGKKVILTISRLAEGKGFPLLIRVMSEIFKTVPHLVWIIVGDGQKKNEIIEDIRRNNLQNVVRFIGEVPHANLKHYYYLADLFILLTHPDPKGTEEGLGLVFLEASAAGLPIIAGRSGGVEEGVLHGQTGLVVDAYQGVEIVSAVSRMLNDKEFAQGLGKNAQERIKKEFNWYEQLKKIVQWLY